MSARFHELNVAARQKKKQIADEIWEQYEPYIEQEYRKGRSIAFIASAVKAMSQGNFVPKYVPSSV
jgi:acetylglutamate kinase